MQQYSDLKHTSKSTTEWEKGILVLKMTEWRFWSGLDPTEMLWHDLKQAVHAQKPFSVAETNQFCKEEWTSIPPQWCERFIFGYSKCVIAIVAAKDSTTSHYI